MATPVPGLKVLTWTSVAQGMYWGNIMIAKGG